MKSKVLAAFILGIFSCATLSVGALGDEGSESGSESGSHSSDSFSYNSGSFDGSSWDSDSIEGGAVDSEMPTVPAATSGETGILGSIVDESGASQPAMTGLCSNFGELVARLRARQMRSGKKQVEHSTFIGEDDEGWTEDWSEYVYWTNTQLPAANINLYNKWCGDNLQHDGGDKCPNGVAALLPTAFAMRGRAYTEAGLRNIILDESNWVLRQAGMQSTNRGICQDCGAKCSTFEGYVSYLRLAGVSIR